MNNNSCLKKKDIIVIFINLMVLFIVIYLYYIIDSLKTILSNANVLKKSSKSDLTEDYTNNFDDFKTTNQNVNIRHTRSTNSVKSHKLSSFSLAQPNIDFEQNGILGPWILSNKSLSNDKCPIKLTSRRTLLEIVDEGLYFVYIQVYYLSSSVRNSFTMTKITADINETLSVCSAMGACGTEISCFTSIVEYFKTGESILIRLREMSSSISLSRKASHTYLGFIKLS